MIKLFEKYKVLPRIMACLIAMQIFFLSSLSLTGTGTGNPWLPRLYHFSAFFLLAFFIFASIKKTKIQPKQILATILVSMAYALSDEIHQSFVPFRNVSLEDILTDTLGILISTIIFLVINKKYRNSIK